MNNLYTPGLASIEDIIVETSSIKTFVLKPQEQFIFKAGQFIELTVPGIGEAPFTPSSDCGVVDRLEVTVVNAGRVTSLLHAAERLSIVGIRGPYGQGYPLDVFKGKDVVVIGGGVGLAPLRALLYSLFCDLDAYNQVLLYYGARTPQDMVYKEQIPQWSGLPRVKVVTTVDSADAAWQGNVGLVTTLLKDMPVNMDKAVAIVCGPPVMMKFVTFKLLEIGFKAHDIYLSMEKNMSCGLGKCGHCRMGKYYICKDGPVFTYEQLKDLVEAWD